MKSNLVGIILLAAGASVRMGEAKQLLEFQNQTLLRRTVETARQVSDKIVVTLGARSDVLRKEIEDLPVRMAENKNWEQGMGGSLKIGLEKLLETDENLRAAIIMVCDQPLVSVELLEKIINRFEQTNALIVACEYGNTFGVPALFAAEYFPNLLALDASHGAKTLLKKYSTEVAAVSFPEGAFDIDTPEDFERLKKLDQDF